MWKFIFKWVLPKIATLFLVTAGGLIGALLFKEMQNTETHKVEIAVDVRADTITVHNDPIRIEHDTLNIKVEQPEHIEPAPLGPVPYPALAVPDLKETVCLAQAAFSETDRPHEQLAVAWSVRNRVESDRYPDTYCGVVFQRKQYSGLNRGDPNYTTNINIPKNAAKWMQFPESDYRGRAANRYTRALTIARTVIASDPVMDVCPGATHFWSPIVYHKGKISWPDWAKNIVADCVIRDRGTKTLRFAFYKNIL